MNMHATRMRRFYIALSLVFVISAIAQGPESLLKLSVPPADQMVHYGSDPLQFGELRLPKTRARAPIVLIVHGGCWADHLEGYDPRATTYALMRPLAAALTEAGAATWNIEYRRSGSPGGSWAATYLDIAAATDYLRKLASANNLDLSNIIVVGHSSGGQLALWLGARSKLPKTSSIYTRNPLQFRKIIDLDGPPDLAAGQPLEANYCPIPAVTRFMEGTPAAQPQRYHDGSAQPFLPLGTPQIIAIAALLEQSPGLVTSYKVAAESKGDSVTLLSLHGASHFDPINPDTPSGKVFLKAILAAAEGPR